MGLERGFKLCLCFISFKMTKSTYAKYYDLIKLNAPYVVFLFFLYG